LYGAPALEQAELSPALETPLCAQGLPENPPDRAAPTGAVDSKGSPGQFCLWIPKCSGDVWNVFSCCVLHLHSDTEIPHRRGALQITRIER
jgi:hypothetical protein